MDASNVTDNMTAPTAESHSGTVSIQLAPDQIAAATSDGQAQQVMDDLIAKHGEPIGLVKSLSGTVTVTHADGSSETLKNGSPIFVDDDISTEKDSAVEIHFADQSKFSLGPDSQMLIDNYVYDPAKVTGEQKFSVLKGVFVFVSGLVADESPENVGIKTPAGTLGIRGTVVGGTVDANGMVKLTLVEGAAFLRGVNGKEVDMKDRLFTIEVDSDGKVETTQMTGEQAKAFFAPLAGVAGETLTVTIPEIDWKNVVAPGNQQDPAATPGEEGGQNSSGTEQNGANANQGDNQGSNESGSNGNGTSQGQAPASSGGSSFFASMESAGFTPNSDSGSSFDSDGNANTNTGNNTGSGANDTTEDVTSAPAEQFQSPSQTDDGLLSALDDTDNNPPETIIINEPPATELPPETDGGVQPGDDTGALPDGETGGDPDSDTETPPADEDDLLIEPEPEPVEPPPTVGGGSSGPVADTLFGAATADTIVSTSASDFVFGFEDDDVLIGNDGADTLVGNRGSDTLLGGSGNDLLIDQGASVPDTSTAAMLITSDPDNDLLDGGDGDDRIYALGGNDTIYGGLGNDVIDAGVSSGYLYAFAGDGADTIMASDGGNYIDAGTGADYIQMDGSGVASVFGGDGADTIDAGLASGSLSILGDAGNDIIVGSTANSTLIGGDGDDGIMGQQNNDYINGDAGNDYIEGGSGYDQLYGGAGHDLVLGQGNGDIIYGADGDDILDGGHENDSIWAGDGNDTIAGGGGNNRLDGQNGDDRLTGGTMNDTLIGGDGNDVFYGGDGTDLIYGNDGDDQFFIHKMTGGTDSIITGNGADSIFLTLNALNNMYFTDITDLDNISILGSAEKMKDARISLDINSSSGATIVSIDVGADGTSDVSFTLGKPVLGYTGTVTGLNYELNFDIGDFYGASSSGDTITVTADDAGVVFGGAGNDSLSGNILDDRLDGGHNSDTIIGGDGRDSLFGGDSNDTLNGDDGNDSIQGDNNHDLLYGGAGDDTLYGGVGDDTLYGGLGVDYMFGGDGNDCIVDPDGGVAMGGSGVDRFINENVASGSLYVGDFGDVAGEQLLLKGSYGSAIITAHFNTDTGQTSIRVDGQDAFVLDGNVVVSSPTTYISSDIYKINITSVSATQIFGVGDSEVLAGALGSDTLYGGVGNDTLYGGVGNDTLYGDAGIDTVYGGVGNDKLYAAASFNGADSAGNVLYGGDGNDWLKGSANADVLDAGAGTNETIFGADGNDTMWGSFGVDSQDGGNGSDLIYGRDGHDTLRGDADNDIIFGDAGNDSLYGGMGDDTLYGGSGSDVIWGDDGNDAIYSGSSQDFIYGGSGADSFYGTLAALDGDNISGYSDGDNDRIIILNINLSSPDILFHFVPGSNNQMTIDWNRDLINDVTVQLGSNNYNYVTVTTTDIDSNTASVLSLSTVDAVNNLGTSGDETINGSVVSDSISGGSGNDLINGDSGNDTLYGGVGDDLVNGGAGADTLYAEAGSDSLFGGIGDDVVSLNNTTSHALIDGDVGYDRLIFSGGGLDLDFTSGGTVPASSVQNIEEIGGSLTSSTITLDVDAVLGMTDSSNELVINFSTVDTIYLSQEFHDTGMDAAQGGAVFDIYAGSNGAGSVNLLINNNLAGSVVI